MKTHAVLALVGAQLTLAGPSDSEARRPALGDVALLTAGRHGGLTSVSVVAKPGWHLNTAGPLRLTLGHLRLGLEEAHLRAPEPHANAAAGASWIAEGVHVSEGRLTAAFCTDRSCLPPFTVTFPIRGEGGR